MRGLKLYFGLARTDWLVFLMGTLGLFMTSIPSYLIALDTGKLSDWIEAISIDLVFFVVLVFWCKNMTKKRVQFHAKEARRKESDNDFGQ